MITTITHARLFDGERVLDPTTVTIENDRIVDVGGPVSPHAEVVDARGATLLPGLIDAHVHTSAPALAQALRFGVTTELEMQGAMTGDAQRRVGADPALADVRSSGFALTPPGGHPSELFPAGERPGGPPRGDGPAAGHAVRDDARGGRRLDPPAGRGRLGLHQGDDRRRHRRRAPRPAVPRPGRPSTRPSPRRTGSAGSSSRTR